MKFKLPQTKWKRWLLGVFVAIVAFVAIVIIFISPITKYVVEKNSVKWTGRQIKMSYAYVNPFTLHVHFHNFRFFEPNSDTVFFSATGITVDMSLIKLLSKTYQVNHFTLNEPYARIVQNKKAMNFDDLITRFTPKDTTPPDPNKAPTKFNVLDVEIKNGEFHYEELSQGINYFIKTVNVSTPGYRWNVDSVAVKYSLQNGPSTGDIKGDAKFNLKTMLFGTAVTINHFDLDIINQYLKPLANYGMLKAFLDGDLNIKGNANDPNDVLVKGYVGVNKFHFGKKAGDDYMSFDSLALTMTEINPKGYKFIFDTVAIKKLFFKYEKYDQYDNLQNMFGEGGQNIKQADASRDQQFNLIIELAHYIQDLAKNFLESYYKLNKLGIYDANIAFRDYSTREKFAVEANPLNIISDSINKNHDLFHIALSTGIQPYGNIKVALQANPHNFGTFAVDYNLERLPAPMFNPYITTYTSFPFDRGTIEAKGRLAAVDSQLNGENHILIIDPRLTKRIKKKDTKWIPVPLAIAIVRNPGEAIDFQVPIRGSLSDPKFKLWPAIFEVLKNIFIKPPTSPYLAHVKNIEGKVEKFHTINWGMREAVYKNGQQKYVNTIADFLAKDPSANITILPVEYEEKEIENIYYFEAKKKYFLQQYNLKTLSEDDSIYVDKMSVKDSTFMLYMKKLANDKMMFTLIERCQKVIPENLVNTKYAQLKKQRQEYFLTFFKDDAAKRVKFQKSENYIPYNGFSYYKIQYKDAIPPQLEDAYDQIDDINDKQPRRKYLIERRALKHASAGPTPVQREDKDKKDAEKQTKLDKKLDKKGNKDKDK